MNNLKNGTYQIIIQARDLAGNASGSQPFTTIFQIGVSEESTTFLAFPEPSTRCKTFALRAVDSFTRGKLQLYIFTGTGILLDSQTATVEAGTTQFEWCKTSTMPIGTYLYKMIFEDQNGQHRFFEGKMTLID